MIWYPPAGRKLCVLPKQSPALTLITVVCPVRPAQHVYNFTQPHLLNKLHIGGWGDKYPLTKEYLQVCSERHWIQFPPVESKITSHMKTKNGIVTKQIVLFCGVSVSVITKFIYSQWSVVAKTSLNYSWLHKWIIFTQYPAIDLGPRHNNFLVRNCWYKAVKCWQSAMIMSLI